MEYSNVTKLTLDELVNLLSKVVSNKKKMILSAITSLVLLTIVILNWDNSMKIAYILMSILVSSGFILSILVILLDKWMIKKSNKSFVNGVTYTYTFKENDFTVTSLIDKEKKTLKFKYSSLAKVVLDDKNIYLYPTNVSIYCAKFNGFETLEEKEEVMKILNPYITKKVK